MLNLMVIWALEKDRLNADNIIYHCFFPLNILQKKFAVAKPAYMGLGLNTHTKSVSKID